MATPRLPRDRNGFKVAVVCALPLEAEMIQATFERNWTNEGVKYSKAPGDNNAYTTGSIGDHNIVLTHMAEMGGNNAAATAAGLRSSYRRIEVVFLVGICGAAPFHPETREEVILGDCVISTAMIQYDFGRQLPDGFSRKRGLEDSLGRSNPETRAMISRLKISQNQHLLTERLMYHLGSLQRTQNVDYPGPAFDRLYNSSYPHKHHDGGGPCSNCSHDDGSCTLDCVALKCDPSQLVHRKRLENFYQPSDQRPRIHFGRVGSANSVMKSGITRDNLTSVDNIVAFEMEGAGIWEQFPTIIIKSVCDYADSHKNKGWQRYAAASAAACLKSLFEQWEVSEPSPIEQSMPYRFNTPWMEQSQQPNMMTMPPSKEWNPWNSIDQSLMAQLQNMPDHHIGSSSHMRFASLLLAYANTSGTGLQNSQAQQPKSLADQLKEIDTALKTPPYEDPLTHLSSVRLDGTCNWIFHNPVYQQWSQLNPSKLTSFLWLHAGAGNGKTVLCASIVKSLKNLPHLNVFHYFSSAHPQSNTDLSCIVRYWISEMARCDNNLTGQKNVSLVQSALYQYSVGRVISAADVWNLFGYLLSQIPNCVFVLDGLDEYDLTARQQLLINLKTQLAWKGAKVLVTSRDESDIGIELGNTAADIPGVSFESYRIAKDDTESDISLLSNNIIDRKLPKQDSTFRSKLATTLTERCDGMFLWVQLASQRLYAGQSQAALGRAVDKAPAGLNSVYAHKWRTLIQQSEEEEKLRAIAILRWCTYAITPLTIAQLAEALAVSLTDDDDEFDSSELPDEIDEDFINRNIKGLCGSFVELRTDDPDQPLPEQTVHLIHGSVKDFLLEVLPEKGTQRSSMTSKAIESAQHLELSKICLRYLCYTNITADFKHENGMECEFRKYAMKQWHVHQNASQLEDQEFIQLALRFLDAENTNFVDWSSTFEPPDDGDPPYEFEPALPFYYAASLGLVSVLKDMHSHMTDPIDSVAGYYGTAFNAACAMDHRAIFDLLINWGADLNFVAGKFGTPLVTSARFNHPDITETLLDRGADSKKTNKNDVTPLAEAAVHGAIECAKVILKHDPDTIKTPKGILNPLLYAAYHGYDDIVDLLLDRGTDIAVIDDYEWTPLHWAAHKGHIDVVKLLLDRGADVNSPNVEGLTPLHKAAGYGFVDIVNLLIDRGAGISAPSKTLKWTPLHQALNAHQLEIVELLLDRGADVDAPDRNGWQILHFTIITGDIDGVKIFLDKGVDINAPNQRDGNTPINHAANEGHFDIAKLLLDRGAKLETAVNNNGWTAMHQAAANGNLDVMNLLVEHGADIFAINKVTQLIALHYAVANGHLEATKYFLDRGLDITAVNEYGWTPLHFAAANNHIEVMKLLFDHGAAITIPVMDKDGDTALMVAALYGFLDIVKYLIGQGADFTTISNKSGWTLLHYPAANGHLEVFKYVLDLGADVNATRNDGDTVLMVAARHGHPEIAKFLISQGIDVGCANKNDGWTALHNAAINNHVDIVKLLVDAGADIQATNANEDISLMIAARYGFLDIVEFFLDRGTEADVNAPNKSDGWTPLHYAVVDNHIEVIKLLLDRGADINAARTDGDTTITMAARLTHFDTVEFLVERGADINSSTNGIISLHYAANEGSLETVQLLLDHGANAASAMNGWTPLHYAVSNGHIEVVKLLLARGSDPKLSTTTGDLPVSLATDLGSLEMVPLLFENSNLLASSHTTTEGRTLLHSAARKGHIELFDYFIAQKMDPNTRDLHGKGILDFACIAASPELLEKILAIKDLNHTTTDIPPLWSPWHWACRTGTFDILKLLDNADIPCPPVTTSWPQAAWSPLDIARYYNNLNLLSSTSDLDPAHPWSTIQNQQVITQDESSPKGVYSNTLGPMQKRFRGYCDGCGSDIFGPRFKCQECSDFDYCFMCKYSSEQNGLHLGHEWNCIEPEDETALVEEPQEEDAKDGKNGEEEEKEKDGEESD